jgi:multimeric flavodoxin WrbA
MPALAILGTARRSGHTATLLSRLTENTSCEMVDLLEAQLGPFSYSPDHPRYDFLPIIERLVRSDVVIFATPVYWFTYSAIMKNFIDRFSELLIDHQDVVEQIRGRDFVLLSTGSSPEPEPALEVAFEKFCAFFGANCFAKLYARRDEDFFDPIAAEKVRRRLLVVAKPAGVEAADPGID